MHQVATIYFLKLQQVKSITTDIEYVYVRVMIIW